MINKNLTKKKNAFRRHKNGARRRGIEFCFTYEQWCSWWKSKLGDDWFELRGTTHGKYVMARHGDIGPYHPDNVDCITCGENSRQIDRAKRFNYLWTISGRRLRIG